MTKKGDQVVLKSPYWHKGSDIGGYLGLIIDDSSYLLINIYEFEDNPVKCFRSEVETVPDEDNIDDAWEDNEPWVVD